MGMFDWVEYRATCDCGAGLTGFQSKDSDCTLATILPSEVRRFYTHCEQCGKWHEFKVVPTAYTVVRVTREDS